MAADPTHAGQLGTGAPDAPLCSFHVSGRKFEIRLVRHAAALPGPRSSPGRGEVGRLAIDDVVLVVQEEAQNHPLPCERNPAELLTARELQIASLVAQGLPTKRIADMLHITDFTVATHLRRAYAKLNVGNRAAMVFRCASLLGGEGEGRLVRQRGLG